MTAASVPTRRDLDGLGDPPEGVVMLVADTRVHYEWTGTEWLQLVWVVVWQHGDVDLELYSTPAQATLAARVAGEVRRMRVQTWVGQ